MTHLHDWIMPVARGVALLFVLELVYFLLRRLHAKLKLRALYHLWALALSALLALVPLHTSGGGEMAWRSTLSLAAILTVIVGFALLESLILLRPWKPSLGPMMPKLARDVMRLLLLVTAVLLVAKLVLDYKLSTVLISSTVLSAVVGLALQDVLKNIFAGVALDLERPFTRGDWLEIEGVSGVNRVLDMSWRSTHLRSKQGVDIYEPNAKMSDSRVINYGSGNRPVALLLEIGLPFTAPPREAESALLAAARSAPGVVGIPQPRVFLASYGDSAMIYQVRVWTKNVHDLNGLRDAVLSRMWYELERRKIVIPFPIRTLYMHQAREEEHELEAAEHAQAVALFSRLDLFSELDPQTVEALAASTEAQAFDDGEVLVEEGDSGDSLFVIAAGKVAISKAQSGGGSVELATLEAGEFFGEMSLLTGEPRSATVAARGVCRVLKLTKSAIAPLVQDDPKVAEALSRALAARRAEAEATLERERGRVQPKPQADQISLLHRIRSFFTIGNDADDSADG